MTSHGGEAVSRMMMMTRIDVVVAVVAAAAAAAVDAGGGGVAPGESAESAVRKPRVRGKVLRRQMTFAVVGHLCWKGRKNGG